MFLKFLFSSVIIEKQRQEWFFNTRGGFFCFFWHPLEIATRLFVDTTKEHSTFIWSVLFNSFHSCRLPVMTVGFLNLILISPHPEGTRIFTVSTRKNWSSVAFFQHVFDHAKLCRSSM